MGPGSFDWDAGVVGKTYKSSMFNPISMLFWEPDETNPGYSTTPPVCRARGLRSGMGSEQSLA